MNVKDLSKTYAFNNAKIDLKIAENEETDKEEKIKYKAINGFFNFKHDELNNKYLIEIKPEQLNKPFLMSATRIATNSGEDWRNDSEAMLERNLVYFKKIGNNIQLIAKQTNYRADETNPINESIDRAISEQLIAGMEIKSIDKKNKTIKVDATDFFINNLEKSEEFDPKNSYINSVKSYKHNSEIETVFHYQNNKTRSDYFRKFNISFSPLPEHSYIPRLPNDKVGYFQTEYTDLSDPVNYKSDVRYIERWKLEKKDPDAEISEPKEPIVYWIENTFPDKYKDAVRGGILSWNKAFEKAGFKNAIVVKEQSKDAKWDPADINHNTVCWIMNPNGGYAAGPSFANPLTGEIYAADVRLCEDTLRNASWEFDKKIKPLLESRGITVNETDKENFLKDSMKALVSHEIGHTLGLRHNFKGSNTVYPDGKTNSIMDYLPTAIQEGKNGMNYYIQTEPGPYDEFAIAYGYKPVKDAKTPQDEKAELEKRAVSEFEYAEDRDANFDPSCNRWDYGDTFIYFEEKTKRDEFLLYDALKKIENSKTEEYKDLRPYIYALLSNKKNISSLIPKYIGGSYHNRGNIGQLNGKLNFEPVAKKDQIKALDYLNKNIFSENSFNLSADLIKKIPNYNPYDIFKIIQKNCLENLLSINTLDNVIKNETINKEDTINQSEFFNMLKNEIWSELSTFSEVNQIRQELQVNHLNKLIKILKEDINQDSSAQIGQLYKMESKALALRDLTDIKNKIEAMPKDKINEDTRFYYEMIHRLIDKELKDSKY